MNNNTHNVNSFLAALLLNYPPPSLSTLDLSNNEIPTTDLSNNFLSVIDILQESIPQLNTSQSSNIQNLLQTTLNQKNCYKNVLSDEGKTQVKTLTYDKNNFKETKCPILQVPFEEGETIAQLPCGHIFNKDSIMQWLEEESNKCPVCRFELDSKEKKNNVETPATHPYGPTNRRIGFTTFLNNYYEAQEDRLIQRAIEQSLLDLDSANEVSSDADSELLSIDSDIDELI